MIHILERFIIHFASAVFILLAIWFTLRYWMRRNAKVRLWIPSDYRQLLTVCALLVAGILPLREPYDIWLGNQTWYKTIFDQISWFAGAGVAAWGLWRLR